ncbi:MAG TPA: CsgG/HfaB family protein [Phenylobacterium sp.]
MLRVLPVIAALLLTGCATAAVKPLPVETSRLAVIPQRTTTQLALRDLPPPNRPVAVAVYSFVDQTGQYKQTETGQTLSRAVSQGGSSILVKALQDAGRRQWFTVVEREMLKNLLQERQIIREMRERYLGETAPNAEALPSLLFAGVLLEGGIVGYDSNTMTGGAGARFLGIGGNVEYRQDTVTVYLRAVSVRTGEVLANVTTSKTIASQALGAGAFRYVGFKELLETEVGFTKNEPDVIAVQQAVEKAVYALVMEGVEQKLWNFSDPVAGAPLYATYQQERDGMLSAERVEALQRAARKDRPAVVTRAPGTQPNMAGKAIRIPSVEPSQVSGSRADNQPELLSSGG